MEVEFIVYGDGGKVLSGSNLGTSVRESAIRRISVSESSVLI